MSERMEPSAASLETLLAQQGWMQRLARRLVVDEAARDDLLQSAWLDVLKRPPRPGAGLRGFLATVLRRRAAKQTRESARREARERGSAPRESSLPSPAELVSEVEAQRKVVAAVLALDAAHRDVIVLRYFHHLSTRAIARERGLTIAAVESRLRRGLEELRAALTHDAGGDARRWALPLLPVAGRAAVDTAIGITIASGALVMSKPSVAAGITSVLLVAALFFAEYEPAEPKLRDSAHIATLHDAAGATSLATADDGIESRSVERSSIVEVASTPRSAAEASPSPRTCLLRVVDAFGAPASYGDIVLESRGRFAPQLPGLDENGEVNVPRSHGETWLWVFANACAPARLPVSLDSDTLTVTLPRGEIVAGRVEIDGVPARRAVRIELRVSGGFRALAAAPAELYDWRNARTSTAVSSLSTMTDEFGRFRFSGLEPAQRVAVWANDRFATGRADGQPRLLQVEAPRDDLLLSLVTRRFVTGRALDATGNPPGIVLATLEVTNRPNGDSGRSQLEADADGRFTIPFPIEGDVIELEVRSADGSAASRRLEGPFPVEIAFGDLVLAAPQTIRFRALDPDGSPIAGAEAFLAEDPQNRSDATGSDGAGSLRIPTAVEVATLYVHAKGRDLGVATVLVPGVSITDVVLPRATRLRVRLEPADGWPTQMVMVASARMPSAPRELPGLAAIAATTWSMDYGLVEYRDGRLMWMVDFGPTASLELERLTPGVEWTIEARFPRRNRLVEQRITLAPGEEAGITLTPPKPRKLTGRVVDGTGHPIRGASLSLAWPGVRLDDFGGTDGEGRYSLHGILADSIDLLVRRDGFTTARRTGVVVSDSSATLDITLAEGRGAVLHVVDPRGAPVAGARVFVLVRENAADATPCELRVTESEPGVFTLFGLSKSTPTEVKIVHAGRTSTHLLDASTTDPVVTIEAR